DAQHDPMNRLQAQQTAATEFNGCGCHRSAPVVDDAGGATAQPRSWSFLGDHLAGAAIRPTAGRATTDTRTGRSSPPRPPPPKHTCPVSGCWSGLSYDSFKASPAP